MPTVRISTALTAGLLVGLCGCYYYGRPPYGSPYGVPYGGYGPTYPMSPTDGFGSPPPAYVPYGAPSGPSPTPLSPNGATSPSQPDWRTPNGNPAPPYGGGTEKPVPNPTIDDQPFGGGAPAGASLTPGPGPAAAGGLSGSGIQLQPIESGPSYPSGAATPSATVADGHDPFETPMRATSSGSNVTARSASLDSTESRPNPFAYDARNFTWLRGIVDYDSQDQRWVIIYSANPDSTDRYGGSITLSDHPLFQHIKPGDVVLVEGTVDAASFDHHGKPIYRISKLQPLKPKS